MLTKSVVATKATFCAVDVGCILDALSRWEQQSDEDLIVLRLFFYALIDIEKIIDLRWREVDLGSGIITLGKKGAQRTFPLPDPAIKILSDLKDRYGNGHKVFPKTSHVSESGALEVLRVLGYYDIEWMTLELAERTFTNEARSNFCVPFQFYNSTNEELIDLGFEDNLEQRRSFLNWWCRLIDLLCYAVNLEVDFRRYGGF